ncbi:MAG: ROK family protein [Parachlamydiaceae bacterium]|nr:ROK family protein [Parachlamydiaceae bacterium]
MKESKWAIGIDIGGTKINIAAVNDQGQVMKCMHLVTQVKAGVDSIINDIATVCRKLCTEYAQPPLGVGIGMAGQVDSHTGFVHLAPNLYWVDVPLGEKLEKLLGLPVSITNDVRASTIAEWKYGAGKGCDNFVCCFIGTGVGGGIVSNGLLLEGFSNSAGEIGHIAVEMDGLPCTCGRTGCLETYVGGLAMSKRVQEWIAAHPEISHGLGDPQHITAKILVEGFRKNDPVSVAIIGKARKALVAGMKGVVNVLNPERLILGGGIVYGLPELIDWLREDIKHAALAIATKKLEIVPAALGSDSGLIGASALILEKPPAKRYEPNASKLRKT